MTEVQKYIDDLQTDYYWYGRAAAEEEEALYQAQINSWIDECLNDMGDKKSEYDLAFSLSYCPKNIRKARRLNYLKSVGIIKES